MELKSFTLSEHKIVAVSKIMQKLLSEAKLAAMSSANIFISGESGTGKEEIAKYIHEHSLRKEYPFIKVNCAAVPDTLIESEFFGHERGAFTGAVSTRKGRFELAHKGTILLDEISEIPITVQPKLLRVIQEREFERLGGVQTKRVDVRIISTSNREIKKTIEEGLFREDLYYRVNVIPIHIPPLREHKEDILPLARYFLRKAASLNHKEEKTLTKVAERKLLAYHWPGNIRELSNLIERAVIMSLGREITDKNLLLEGPSKRLTLQDLERQHILETLNQYNDNKTHAAKALGISVRTLRNKLKH